MMSYQTRIGLIVFALIVIYANRKACNDRNDYFDKLNLNLTGVVVGLDRVQNFNGFDIIDVKVVSSNRTYYDPRGKYDAYYCIIANGFAELYQGGAEFCSIGDTVEVNTERRLFTIRHNNSEKLEDMMLNDDHRYYEYLAEHHQKF